MNSKVLFFNTHILRFFILLLSFYLAVLFFPARAAAQDQKMQDKPDSVKAATGEQTAKSKPDSVKATDGEQAAKNKPDSAKATDGEQQAQGKPDSAAISHPVDTVMLGERFFKGLLPHDLKQPSCVSCHNLTPTDTLNWNPSAMDIAYKYLGMDFEEFKTVVMQPEGGMMAEVHKGYKYNDADLRAMKAYLTDLAMRGPVSEKPDISRLLFFAFLSLLVIWALLELIFFRKIKYKFIPVIVLTVVMGYQLKILYAEGVRLGRAQGYEPVQPVKFSHKVHSGQNQIDCKYCHYTAETSKLAGIPPADLCLNCHSLVREGARSGKFEIAKIIDANEKHIPVKWIRIHNLPDHVFFSHAQHVNAGKLDCLECHGDVEGMDVVKQVNDLSMGWCLDCHRTQEVQFTDNSFYGKYEELHDKIKKGQIDKVTVEMIGGTDCMKCHY